jgi:hypothetical protein
MIVAGHRMDLGFTPQAAKRAGENNPVMVFMKRAAAQFIGAGQRFTKTLTGKQGLPIQN